MAAKVKAGMKTRQTFWKDLKLRKAKNIVAQNIGYFNVYHDNIEKYGTMGVKEQNQSGPSDGVQVKNFHPPLGLENFP